MASQPYRTTPAPAATHRRSGAGFTLVELLVTVTIVSILLTIGVPSFTDFIRTTRVSSATFDLLSDLNFARSEAIKGGTRVTVCKSTDGAACSTGTAGYETGWLVFRDCDGDGVLEDCDSDGTTTSEVLRIHAALSNTVLKGDSKIINRACFGANGRATGLKVSATECDAPSDGIYSVCLAGQLKRQIEISPLGRISLKEKVSGTCP